MMRRLLGMIQGESNADRDKTVVAVVGALRSGTNYLKYLLEQNYDVTADFNAFGWKHAGVPVLADGTGFEYPDLPLTYIVKNPYATVVSLHRYHQRKVKQGHVISLAGEEDFNAFLTSPVTVFDSQLKGSPQLRFANPVQYWNFVYWNLETLDRQRFQAVGFNYEELIVEPEAIFKVEEITRLRRLSQEVATPTNQLKRLKGTPMSEAVSGYETGEDFNPAYYTDKHYLGSFNDEQLAFMRQQVDPWLMQQRGYEIL